MINARTEWRIEAATKGKIIADIARELQCNGVVKNDQALMVTAESLESAAEALVNSVMSMEFRV